MVRNKFFNLRSCLLSWRNQKDSWNASGYMKESWNKHWKGNAASASSGDRYSFQQQKYSFNKMIIMKQKPCHLQRRYSWMFDDCIHYTNECSCWRSFTAWTAQESEMLFETHLKAKFFPTAAQLKEVWFRDAGLSNFKRLVARKVLLYRTEIWLLQYNREHYIAFESKEHFEHFFSNLKESLAPFDAVDVKNKK